MPLIAADLIVMPPALVTSTIPTPIKLSEPEPSPKVTAVGALIEMFLLPELEPPPLSAMVPAVVAVSATLSFKVRPPVYVWLPLFAALLVSTLIAPVLKVVVPETLKNPILVVAPIVLLNAALPDILNACVPAVSALTVLSKVTVVPVKVLVVFESSVPNRTALR